MSEPMICQVLGRELTAEEERRVSDAWENGFNFGNRRSDKANCPESSYLYHYWRDGYETGKTCRRNDTNF